MVDESERGSPDAGRLWRRLATDGRLGLVRRASAGGLRRPRRVLAVVFVHILFGVLYGGVLQVWTLRLERLELRVQVQLEVCTGRRKSEKKRMSIY